RGIPRCAFAAARESASGSEPGDRPELPHQDETNKTAPLGRDRAAPSSLASTANRMATTESPFLKTINDFCNKICHKLPLARLTRSTCRPGGELTRELQARFAWQFSG